MVKVQNRSDDCQQVQGCRMTAHASNPSTDINSVLKVVLTEKDISNLKEVKHGVHLEPEAI